ncbi:hypothetical protein [Paenibacillus sp. B1-33]|uniref:hypothetical protein n=1 Tax=unclassified Paenibacillus TaxID=185978 RepID=UPI003D2C3761
MEQRIASFIGTDGLLEHIRFEDGTEISRSGGFVTPKFIQSTSFAEQLGCELSTSGGIMTEGLGKTTIPGFTQLGMRSPLHLPKLSLPRPMEVG